MMPFISKTPNPRKAPQLGLESLAIDVPWPSVRRHIALTGIELHCGLVVGPDEVGIVSRVGRELSLVRMAGSVSLEQFP